MRWQSTLARSTVSVYGRLSSQAGVVPWSPSTYDAEGTQYQLYANQGVTASDHGFCAKEGADSWWWWLRSSLAYYSDGFHSIILDGDWYDDLANHVRGVSPGFCL